jgi:minor extracellular serine protease Vpr
MRTPPRPRLARFAALGAVATAATALVAAGAVQGAGESLARAWHAVLGERPPAAYSERVIVVLSTPSLADRFSALQRAPSARDQRRWSAEADAQQRALVAGLRQRGIEIRRDYVYTRTLSGFSAVVEARAVAELERNPIVTGLYPVRAVYLAEAPGATGTVGTAAAVSLPGYDGRGVSIALLDTGVDRRHPDLRGHVAAGADVVERKGQATAAPDPSDPARIESHGTRMAGVIAAIAPAARLLPLRVVDWQGGADGSVSVGRGDQLIAGFERAVDPDRDGDVDDAADIAVAAVVEPFAAFADSPEARAVAGSVALGTLVVAPAGNDGRPGAGFGTVGAPGGAPDALAVGALDSRTETLAADVNLRVGDDAVLEASVPLLGPLGPVGDRAYGVSVLLGPSLADRGRGTGVGASGSELGDFFDGNGVSRVAGRVALVPADGRSLARKARNAAAAGAAALAVYGTDVPAGALDLDADAPLPVLALPVEAGRAAVQGLRDGETVTLAAAPARRVPNAAGLVAPFSAGGLAFDGRSKPDLVAAGVGLQTAGPGVGPDGSPRRATLTGTSAAAAVVAGGAALLTQARPELAPAELKSVLVGSAIRLEGSERGAEPVTVQGAGALDLGSAAAAELAVEPGTLALGRADGPAWSVTRTIEVRNVSSRTLDVGFGFAPDQPGEPAVTFTAEPARLELGPGASAQATLVATLVRDVDLASGALVVSADGARPARVPWAIARRRAGEPLVESVALSNWEFQPSRSAPAVLAFRAGRASGGTVEPVGILDLELWTQDGKRLGMLARLRDLLPGRYAFGLTGRGPNGKVLKPGTYVVRLLAQPVDAADGASPSTAQAVFRIVR